MFEKVSMQNEQSTMLRPFLLLPLAISHYIWMVAG